MSTPSTGKLEKTSEDRKKAPRKVDHEANLRLGEKKLQEARSRCELAGGSFFFCPWLFHGLFELFFEFFQGVSAVI